MTDQNHHNHCNSDDLVSKIVQKKTRHLHNKTSASSASSSLFDQTWWKSPIQLLWSLIILCGCMGILFSFIHVHHQLPQLQSLSLHDFLRDDATTTTSSEKIKATFRSHDDVHEPPHYHNLNCERYGGPSKADAQEMVYWKDIPSDSHYISPFHPNNKRNAKAAKTNNSQQRKYMTFEPDGGGWNNIRMAMETVVGLAIATGRILVLPPEQRMYLLAKNRGKMKTDFSFLDFFPFIENANDNDGLTIITMQQFLDTEAMAGNLRYKDTGKIAFPPNNRTDWNGQDVKLLKEWLRNVTHTPLWAPEKCLAVFPAGNNKDTTIDDVKHLHQMHQEIVSEGFLTDKFLNNPTPVDASPKERMRENLAHRSELCVYDTEMQEAFVVHFMCYHKLRVRMLVHFYAFLFFEDCRDDLWMKRFMRDHMRYTDEIQCAAARVVHAVRQQSIKKSNNGDFDSLHVRRGDFQYKNTRISAEEIYENIRDVIQEGSTVFIATDERDKKFFDPLRAHFDVYFLDDFTTELGNINHNFFGMIDQLVASRSQTFFGCWHSTFTGFIHRMRGYHSAREKLAGHENGLLPNSYYYVPKSNRDAMHKYAPLQGAFFSREFPTAWYDLDKSVGDLPHVYIHEDK